MRSTIWRGPDGRHWTEGDSSFDQAAGVWVYRFTPAVQDPGTGQWAADPAAEEVDVAGHPGQVGYTEVSADPLAEPRIARLHAVVAELLADYQRDTGRLHPRAAELRLALEDVAAIPGELRRRGHAAASQAARSAYHQSRRRGR